MRRRGLTAGLGLGLALAIGPLPLAAGAAPAEPGAGAGPVTVSDAVVGFTFVLGAASLNAPGQMLRIHTGDTVQWTNFDPVSHSVAFDALPTTLYLKSPGDTAKVTFTRAGYYTYRCNEHPQAPGMKGLVFVVD
ncbi:MAG TPA: plastocyanin/azurin family copper-binding protein [Acidimicrobiia bacterium]|nr:plastocyanin/azurin family copper-binding protein [Acidimicrobiia bacterium]